MNSRTMMSRTMITTIGKRWLMVLALVAASLSLTGCFNDKSHHKGGEMMFEYIAWKLDLSDEQQVLLDEVRQEMKKIHQQHREQRAQDKDTVIALINADTLDTTTAMTLLQKKQAMIAANAPAVLDKIAAFHATLTPQQKAIVIEKLNKMDRYHQ